MRDLTITTFLSLDGVMQAPGAPDEDRSGGFDQGGWLPPLFDAETGAAVDAWFARAGAIVLGRRTYESMAGFWPQAGDGDPTGYALNNLPKHVATTTTDDLAWNNSTVLEGDVVEAVRALKQQPGDELQVHGSWQLAQTLIAHDLIDTFHLLTFPVVLGRGKRLFPDGVPVGLRLASSSVTSNGIVISVYERGGDVRYGSVDAG